MTLYTDSWLQPSQLSAAGEVIDCTCSARTVFAFNSFHANRLIMCFNNNWMVTRTIAMYHDQLPLQLIGFAIWGLSFVERYTCTLCLQHTEISQVI